MRNQTHGDLDEARLIEGLAGEKAIYRRRGEKEPEVTGKELGYLCCYIEDTGRLACLGYLRRRMRSITNE